MKFIKNYITEQDKRRVNSENEENVSVNLKELHGERTIESTLNAQNTKENGPSPRISRNRVGT